MFIKRQIVCYLKIPNNSGVHQGLQLPSLRQPGDPEQAEDRPQAVRRRKSPTANSLSSLLGHNWRSDRFEKVFSDWNNLMENVLKDLNRSWNNWNARICPYTNVGKCFRFYFSNENMKAKNYDGRTALHLAASEGHLPCVKFLVETCQLDPLEKDRLIKLSLG